MPRVEIVAREDDGAAWFASDTIYINVRWLHLEEEAEWFLDESFIHEYVEHVLGLGHERAVYVENVLRRLLYREWFGKHPLRLLYAETEPSIASSVPGRAAPLRSL